MTEHAHLFAEVDRQIEAVYRARRSDPLSSKLAAAEVTANVIAKHQQGLCVEAVRKYPGRTSMELAQATRLDRYMLARRLPECVKAGAIRKGEQRTCEVSGRLALTWWPLDELARAA